MLKKNISLKDFILFLIIIILIILNITSSSKSPILEDQNEEPTTEIIFNKKPESKYDSNKKYYNNITYKKFKTKYKSSNLSTIAIVDTSSLTYESFIKMINKLAYIKEETIYVLELNNLSKKDLSAFNEYDERFNTLESGYIITVKDSKILSLTTYDSKNIRLIIEGLGE